MKKEDFIVKLADKAGLTKKDADVFLKAFLETTEEVLASGDSITFVGFGKFSVSERAAREGRNPRTGETMQIAASKVPTFKAGNQLKEAVNK